MYCDPLLILIVRMLFVSQLFFHLLTAQRRKTLHENEAFLYNPVFMPTMTSANNNQPHSQKYVTNSHKNATGQLLWLVLLVFQPVSAASS